MDNTVPNENFLTETDSESSCDLQCDVSLENDGTPTEEGIIEPYRFEPYIQSDEEANNGASSSSEEEDMIVGPQNDEGRLQNTDWCSCGKCVPMPTVLESVCCMEIEKVLDKRNTQPGIDCITDHEGFCDGCLRVVVLEIAYHAYRQEYGPIPVGNDWKRYTAYRQFVRWCFHYLGKKIRVPLPSCVVNKVRLAFPADQYTGFQNAPMENN